MRNLFIMHTQYNLILASAVANHYKDDENILVLYSEFKISDSLLKSMNQTFSKVIVANDNFVTVLPVFKEVKQIKKCVKKTEEISDLHFDNVFMSQERIFDLILYTRAKKINKNLKCYDIEEDAYYSLNNKKNQPNYIYKIGKKAKLSAIIKKIMLINYPYVNGYNVYFYGQSFVYDGGYVLFPNLVRKGMERLNPIEITKDDLKTGINALYSDFRVDYPESDKYIVLFFDLMSRYKNPELVKEMVCHVIKQCVDTNRTVLAKYHPRETEKFEEFNDITEIDKVIPAEKVLLDLDGKDVVVFGNATTACIVAAKMDYKVYSVCKIEMSDNKTMHEKMTQMGLECVEKVEDISLN